MAMLHDLLIGNAELRNLSFFAPQIFVEPGSYMMHPFVDGLRGKMVSAFNFFSPVHQEKTLSRMVLICWDCDTTDITASAGTHQPACIMR